jgi:hypothetical protein
MRALDTLHLWMIAGTLAVLLLSVALAAAGVEMAVCLIVVALAPAVTVGIHETFGHRHVAEALERL